MDEGIPEDQRTLNAMRTLAAADPDYAAFVAQHPQLTRLQVSPAVEADLVRDALSLLQALPDRSAQLERLKHGDTRFSFDAGAATVPITLAVFFLLRTRFRFKVRDGGKWELEIEHKPADSKLIAQLLAKISKALSSD